MKTSSKVIRLSLIAGWVVVLAVVLAPHIAFADNCTSNNSGPWETPANWSCNKAPASGDHATISSGHTITLGSGSGTAWYVDNVTVDASGVLVLARGIRVTSSTFSVNGTLQMNSGGFVELGTRPTYGTGSTLVYNTNYNLTTAEWDQNVSSGAGVPYNVTINGGNSVSYNGSTFFRQVRGDFTNNGTFTLGGISGSNAGDLKVAGDFSGNGTLNPNTREVEFNGSGAQTINSATTWDYLAINNSGSGVSLAANQTVNTRLRFANGLLKLGASSLTLGSSAEAVDGSPFSASKMVVADGSGALCKQFTANGSYDYPIGDDTSGSDYSPVTSFSVSGTGYSGAAVCFRVTDAVHPSKPAAATTYITRYWTGTQSGTITGLSYGAMFNFLSGDVVQVGAETMHGKKWNNGPAWTELGAVSGNAFSGTGLTSFSEFTAFRSGILAVTLADFYAQQVADHVQVTWETASELGNMGFNLYRGTTPAGPDRQLNDLLIPSQSLGNPGGFTYTWDDSADLVPGMTYYYWVEDVDVNGAATRHGPVSVDFVVPTAVTLGSVQASPAAGAVALPWLLVVAGAGVALGVSRMRRKNLG